MLSIGIFHPQTVKVTLLDGRVFTRSMSDSDVWNLTIDDLVVNGSTVSVTYQINNLSTVNVAVTATTASNLAQVQPITIEVATSFVPTNAYLSAASGEYQIVVDGNVTSNNAPNYALSPSPLVSWGVQLSAAVSPALGVIYGSFSAAVDLHTLTATIPAQQLQVLEGSSSNVMTPVPTMNGVILSSDEYTLIVPNPVPAYGNATVSAENYLYTPNSGYVGQDQITVTFTINGDEYSAAQQIVTVSAPPPAPDAPDETLTVIEGSSGNSITPVITQGGSLVTPDSLSIVTQPAHGSASVNGVSLVYAPSLGYFGTDSFTYKASVSATESNIATVSVGVAPSSISIRQQTTHRAHRHYDSPITCHVRNESGRLDLSAATIEVCVRNLNRQWRALRTLSATGDANGVVSFTIPKGTFYAGTMGADYQLGAGDRRANNFEFEITANGALIYDALLEVV